MLTRIDHVMICVPELAAGIEAYRRIGFDIYPGGEHAGARDTQCHRVSRGGLSGAAEPPRRARRRPRPAAPSPGSPSFCAGGPGFRYIAIQSDDLVADVAAMRGRGVEVSDPVVGGRTTPAGQELRW